ncbi:hypothetical protein QTJ16_002825 [Diplocarpon rosae]|uniref:YTH domain-containing protein n=1 Tax=Diplocarpon rosae TaxID=946125 RepID=A0AAD9T413_9HELO|nr:hypothetical protein QTJ16_002825 [Diplocarpon rosae]
MSDISKRSPCGDLVHRPQGLRPAASSHCGDSEELKEVQGGAHSQSNVQFSQDPFSLASLATSLPDSTHQNDDNIRDQRSSSGTSPASLTYRYQNTTRYAGHPAISSPLAHMQYGLGYQTQYPGIYSPGNTLQHYNSHSNTSGGNQYYSSQVYFGNQLGYPFLVHPGQLGPMLPGPSTAGPFGISSGTLGDGRIPGQKRGKEYFNGPLSVGTRGRPSSTSSGASSVVRGPPRKPRQSEHAIWIGNLPLQTDLMTLVMHVCKEAPGLQSLFLISKSNCAFANFLDETTCSAAQAKINDSRFQTVKLVSRLRRNSVGTAKGVVTPTGPAVLSPPGPTTARSTLDSSTKPKEAYGDALAEVGGTELPKDKYFIVKSLTIEDLDLSVRNGIWATQSHNEQALNEAYQAVENVYLIFSANKSGEYFGYAKMISQINDDPAAAVELAPKAYLTEGPELPKAISIPACEFAPKGRIIDDSARGTIFWEVERGETDGLEEDNESQSDRSDEHLDGKVSSKAWGKPFRVEWLSTTRLPFYRTKGLRNPWNLNREVKIARDGTELETSIGRRLVSLFHRLPSPVVPNIPGSPMCATGVYSDMRPSQ